jgi:NAD(P)-dependent dehydrogenase (short-subunit alcohol dehydrogenase family)
MTDRVLQGKVALITGGGQGVGLGIAQAFAQAGANLAITGRDKAKLEGVAGELRANRVEVLTVPGDVRKRTSAQQNVKAALERFGQLDVLVNNAQTPQPNAPLESIDDETIAQTIESGLLGTLYHMQAAFPHMKEHGGGSIINFGSREGEFGGLGFGVYAATKEGIRGLSRTAAREWGAHGIRVNVICPAALSPAALKFFAENPEMETYYKKQVALGYFGDPHDDIAPVALFLASAASRYVTGQTVNVDGGQMML